MHFCFEVNSETVLSVLVETGEPSCGFREGSQKKRCLHLGRIKRTSLNLDIHTMHRYSSDSSESQRLLGRPGITTGV